jgi:hypothetical protein
MQMDVPLGIALHHHRVLKGEELLLLHVHQGAANLFGFANGWKPNHDKTAHGKRKSNCGRGTSLLH